jgi:ABC-type phosphate transport system ATPase subunit
VTHNINFAEKISDEIAFLSDTRLSVFYPKKELFSPLEVSTGDNANGKPEKMDNSELLRKFINVYKQLSL